MPRKQKLRRTLRRPELTEEQILGWADAFHSLHGTWPTPKCRPRVVQEAPAERWSAINAHYTLEFAGSQAALRWVGSSRPNAGDGIAWPCPI